MLAPAFAVLALIGGLLPSFSVAATLYVVTIGGTLAWLGLTARVPRHRPPSVLPASALWWLAPAGVLAAVEAINYGLGSSYPHPTLSLLMDPVLDHYPARVAGYFGWLAAFWALVRR